MSPPPAAKWEGSKIEDNLTNMLQQYKSITHEFNNYNEIFNLNVYLKNSSEQDKTRLDRTNEVLKSRVIKLKQEYIMQDRDIKFMGFKNGLMYYTIIVTCLMLILVGTFMLGMISQGLLITLVIVISILFIISVIFVIKNNSTRRNVSWDQYYWEPMKK